MVTPLDLIALAFAFLALICNLCFAAVDAWKRWRAARNRIVFPPQKTVGYHIGDEVPF